MSFQAKKPIVLNSQLKSQELNLTLEDSGIVANDGADLVIQVGEEIERVDQIIIVEADGTMSSPANADIAIVNQTIEVTNLNLAAGDKICVKYKV